MNKILSSLLTIIFLYTELAFPGNLTKTDVEQFDANQLLFANYNCDWRKRCLIKNLMSAPVFNKELRLSTFKSLTQKVRQSEFVCAHSDSANLENTKPTHIFLSSRDHKVVLKFENSEFADLTNSFYPRCKSSSPVSITRSRGRSLSIDAEIDSLTNFEGPEIFQDGRLITTPDNRTPLMVRQPKTLFDLVTAPNPNEAAIKAELENPKNESVLRNGLHIFFAIGRGNISPALFSLMNERRRSIESLNLDQE